jgi:hypothetical protein
VLLGVAGTGDGTRRVPVADAVEHGNELRVPFDPGWAPRTPACGS